MPVFLVSSDGTRYNMKSADQNVAGMDRWIRDFSHQMEIFTCDLEDEMIMMRYLLNRAAYCSQTESPILINTYSPRGRCTGHCVSTAAS